MLRVYKHFHQTVKYGHERNHIFQELIGLEIKQNTRLKPIFNNRNRFAKKRY